MGLARQLPRQTGAYRTERCIRPPVRGHGRFDHGLMQTRVDASLSARNPRAAGRNWRLSDRRRQLGFRLIARRTEAAGAPAIWAKSVVPLSRSLLRERCTWVGRFGGRSARSARWYGSLEDISSEVTMWLNSGCTEMASAGVSEVSKVKICRLLIGSEHEDHVAIACSRVKGRVLLRGR